MLLSATEPLLSLLKRKEGKMSLVAAKKKCSNCGRYYYWNPDIGKFQCPYCKKKKGLEKPDLNNPILYPINENNLLKGDK